MDLIQKIKNQLKALVKKEEFAQHKAGEMVISSPDDVLTVGSEVYAVDEDGNNVELADGSYKLDSGEMITVLGGKITEISMEEPEGEGIEDEMPAELEEMADEKEEMAEESVDFGKKIEELEAKINEIYSFMEDFKKKKEEMEAEKAEFSEIVPEPAEKSIEPKKVELKSEKSLNIDLDSIREKVKKLAKK